MSRQGVIRLAFFATLFGSVTIWADYALAQQPAPDAAATRAWQGFAIAQENAVEKIDALIRAYKANLDELSRVRAELDYWRAWCGDKPGCER